MIARNVLIGMMAVAVLAGVAAGQALAPAAMQSIAVKAAPDKTPLLFDRVRAFPDVIIVTLDEGYDKNPEAMPGTNSVYLPVKIVKTLKGQAASSWKLSAHGQLPKLLAARDAKIKNPQYLLACQSGKDFGYLGAGNLYGDLMRFCITDASLEKVVAAFMEVKDEEPGTSLTLCTKLLSDKEISPEAMQHAIQLLARMAAKADAGDWKQFGKDDLAKCIPGVTRAGKSQEAIASAAEALLAISRRTDNPPDVKLFDPSLAEPARLWLTARAKPDEDPARPSYAYADAMPAVVALVGKAKDKSSVDVLVTLYKDQRWQAHRPALAAALSEILGAEAAAKVLEPIKKALPQPAQPMIRSID